MATGIITATGNSILDALRSGGANFNAVAQMYVQAHTGDPGAAGTANVSVGDPTRKAINHSAPAGVSMALSNTPTYTNGGTSETLTHISVHDALTLGNCKYTGILSVGRP